MSCLIDASRSSDSIIAARVLDDIEISRASLETIDAERLCELSAPTLAGDVFDVVFDVDFD